MEKENNFIETENLELLNNILYEAFHDNEKAKQFLIEELPLLYLLEEYPYITVEEYEKEKERLTHFILGLLDNCTYKSDITLSYLIKSMKRKTVRMRRKYEKNDEE